MHGMQGDSHARGESGFAEQSAELGASVARRATGVRRELVAAAERHANIVIVVAALALVVLCAVSLTLGRFPIDPAQALAMLADKVVPIDPAWTAQQESIFFNVRLPRILLSVMVGAGLSAAGAAYQGTFQNPLVSSDILGASQGAALGAAFALLVGASAVQVSMVAFAASMATVGLVVLVARRTRGDHVLTVVLVGVMVSSLCQAGVSFAKLVADPNDQLPAITYWLMGSLVGAKLSDVLLAVVPLGVGLVVLFCLRWRINLLTMGDDEARTMGVDARRVRTVVMVAATLVTASCVAVSGIIGWVGLVIPHLTRMVVGCDYRKLLPASMLIGASFLLVVDNISRLAYTAEIPIGILTAFVGAPFFLFLIMRKKRGL